MYLDASSVEPLLPEARAAWLAAQDAGWGDSARLHRPGRLAAQALDRSREVVAAAVGARPDEVVFTGSGVQSTYAAIAGLAAGRRRVGTKIVTSAIEHSSTLAAAHAYGRCGVGTGGRAGASGPDPVGRGHRIRPEVAAACLQVANHEVGTRQPYEAAAQALPSARTYRWCWMPRVRSAGST